MKFIDPLGLVKHTTGKMIDCGKGCWIRIDYTFDEKTGAKRRHLHWGCKGKEGECGEFGEPSHGGTWENAPESIKQCARRHGFQGDTPPLRIPYTDPLDRTSNSDPGNPNNWGQPTPGFNSPSMPPPLLPPIPIW